MKIKLLENSDDIKTVAALESDCFPEEFWSSDALSAFLEAPIRYCYLLLEDDTIRGYVILTYIEGEAEIERIGVAQEARGRHLGRALLADTLAVLQAERCVLEVSASNMPAVRMYTACGFSEFGKRRAYYRDGADALMMEWKRKDD